MAAGWTLGVLHGCRLDAAGSSGVGGKPITCLMQSESLMSCAVCVCVCAQVGCMGFCMGGALSFLAGQEADVDAIAPFYGTPDPKLAKVIFNHSVFQY